MVHACSVASARSPSQRFPHASSAARKRRSSTCVARAGEGRWCGQLGMRSILNTVYYHDTRLWCTVHHADALAAAARGYSVRVRVRLQQRDAVAALVGGVRVVEPNGFALIGPDAEQKVLA